MKTLSLDSAILVNRTAGEVRVAVVEAGNAVALYAERDRERGIVGNIYRGRVVRVVPGMQSAFVDVGLDRAAFLYVGDVQVAPPPPPAPLDVSPEVARDLGLAAITTDPVGQREEPTVIDGRSLTLADGQTAADVEDVQWPDFEKDAPKSGDPRDPETTLRPVPPSASRSRRKAPRIEDVLRPGQEITVQVSKEAIGTKGARLTTHLAVPGRLLVYLPGSDHVGVSRRITDPDERERLRQLVEGHRRPGEGFIVRTVCEGRSDDVLVADVQYLRELWASIDAGTARAPVPSCIHEELDLVLRSGRDLLSERIQRFVVDDADDHERTREFMQRFMPALADRLHLYEESVPLFEATSIERQITRALGRRVRLPSGGYIVIDHAEALTAIDVNSGRFTGGRDLEETSTRVNLEAAHVIVEQLRLRDIGGLIVIDFIDMEEAEGRRAVEQALEEALQRDPARFSVLPISEFGLLEMTRRRVRDDLARNLQTPCQVCSGLGRLKSAETVAYEILRELNRNARSTGSTVRELEVRCSSDVAEQLSKREAPALESVSRQLGSPVRVKAESQFGRERFSVSFQVRAGGGHP